MKVQLTVVTGKSEGRKIPLAGPVFKVGRGETCHLRPSSEQVSREHAEFIISGDQVTIRDLGSRNGTLLNGKALTEPHDLHDSDLVQIGPLLFSVCIQGDSRPPSDPAARKAAASGRVEPSATDSWLIRNPDDVRSGDTMMIAAFKGPTAPPASSSSDDYDAQYVRQPEGDRDDPRSAPAKSARPKPVPTADSPRKGDAASDILRRMMEQRRTSK